MKKKISIVIPVYNAEKTIRRCIDSLILQTFKEWEAIIVNDGSVDNSGDICDEYAKKDCRFVVLHQENQGASVARNIGIKQAKSKWITFIDADDYVDTSYLETLHKHSESESDTLIIQGLKQISGKIIKKRIEFTNKELSGHSISIAFDKLKIFEHGYTVAKLYSREIIDKNNLQFDSKISYSEDLLFMLEYLLYCNSISYIEGAGYNYVVEASYLSQRYNSFDSEYRLFCKSNKLNNAIAERFKFRPTKESKQNGALMLMRAVYSLYINKIKNKKERITIIKRINAKHKLYISNYYSPKIFLLRIFKIIFLTNIYLFDFCCYHKFRIRK